jgi:hypothetical protein
MLEKYQGILEMVQPANDEAANCGGLMPLYRLFGLLGLFN